MIENLIIGILFLAALGFLGNKLRKEFSAKNSGCAKGCGCEESKVKTVFKTS